MLDLGESEKGTGGADQAAASDRSGTGGQTDCPYPAVSTRSNGLGRKCGRPKGRAVIGQRTFFPRDSVPLPAIKNPVKGHFFTGFFSEG